MDSARYGLLIPQATSARHCHLSGHLDYTDRNSVKEVFQTFTMQIELFHETWYGSQPSAERWLTDYTYYYNHLRNYQEIDDEPPIEVVGLI